MHGTSRGVGFHTHGPLVAYMADCKGPCDVFDASGEVWFKIFETGLLPGWTVVDVDGWNQFPYTYDGWNVTIPQNLKPGHYLIRHEIIYIENDPAQFYPYCAQLTVTGAEGKSPEKKDLVSFPGAYSLADPGIAIAGSFFAPGPTNYTIPGPRVWTGEEAHATISP
ncbi:glycoside hydrolase [Lasiosphaeris hirsuta]|uniref:lytic cellulose monooxygenase (C4-dehydrogenating) n=1 Tax=Lasiosphaeris hirsuta TaxID=260670 RepID=A0AA39ZR41_9PEZI|nr:glycoside hydrolase [Lasiosphaeris hirsuta]